jgi:predicted DNA binding CopG/RHH family protein
VECEWNNPAVGTKHRWDSSHIEQSVVGGTERDPAFISLRIDPRKLAQVKRLARSRCLNYQSTVKQRLSERLETKLRARGER